MMKKQQAFRTEPVFASQTKGDEKRLKGSLHSKAAEPSASDSLALEEATPLGISKSDACSQRVSRSVERKKRLKGFGRKACSNWAKGLRVLAERLKLIFSKACALQGKSAKVEKIS